MKVPSHIVRLYYKSVRRYKKLASRLKKESDPRGYRYSTLLSKLKKLKRTIADLQVQLRLATATGAIVLGLGLTPSQAQTTHTGPFVVQPRHLNPLRPPIKFDGTTYPAVVDLDKDGDFDLVVGDDGNYNLHSYSFRDPLRYLLNIGTPTNPVYQEKEGAENPFSNLNLQYQDRAPVFADIDKDGDEDLFIGTSYSFYSYAEKLILYFKNDNGVFTEQTGPWNPTTKTGNPFENIAVDNSARVSFIDLDKDNDLDAVVAGTFIDGVTGAVRFVSYFKNDGQGTFSEANGQISLSPMPSRDDLNPSFADIDKDGDADLLFGGYYIHPIYYTQVSPGNFVEETEPFDPQTKTGNPFFEFYDTNNQPVFADLDGDSDLDLLMGDGDGDHYFRFPNNIIHFFENKGGLVFEEKLDLLNPLGGVNLREDASPALLDLDSDGDLDAVIGHKYKDYYIDYNVPAHYSFEVNKYVRKDNDDSPLGNIEVSGTITPSIVDLDADGDLDFVTGEYFGQISLFRNDNGEYVRDDNNNPFEGIDVANRPAPELADIDGDGDFDLMLGAPYLDLVHYYENTGTPQVPVFEERVGPENPFEIVGSANGFRGYLNLADVDHDGDLDVLAAEFFEIKYYEFNILAYYENTGTAANPVFAISTEQPFFSNNPFSLYGYWDLQPSLADWDLDGDLDLFVGDYFGQIQYTKNENPAVVATVASAPLAFRIGVDEEVVVDPTITLSDEDDDLVVQATVTISNFQAGDELHFVSPGTIAGSFNSSTGVLTLKGKTSRADYQSTLRTITYHHHEVSGGRTGPPKKATVSKTIAFRVYDTDFTNPQVAGRTLNAIFNDPPVLQSKTEVIPIGTAVTISLNSLVSDPNDNLDLSTLRIVQQPASGAEAHIDTNNNLIIDYDGINFTGQETLTIEVCDDLGECVQNIITIQVNAGEIEVFNAVAPNSTGNNRYMRILNLPEKNKVTIFSRWGDKVFEVENYNDTMPGKRFEGSNNDGKPLASGNYFYEIQFPENVGGLKVIRGYIAVKQ